jgi:Terminase small subunit
MVVRHRKLPTFGSLKHISGCGEIPILGPEPSTVDRESRFIAEYVGDPNRSGTRAAIRAGYSDKSAHVQSTRLLRRDKVRAAIAAAEQKAELAIAAAVDHCAVSKERIIREFAKAAFASMGDYAVIDMDGMPRLDLGSATWTSWPPSPR